MSVRQGPRRLAASAGAAARRLRGLPGGVPLRIKLVAALLALCAFGLAVTGIAAATALRGYLTDRLDSQLKSTAAPIVARIEHGFGMPGDGGDRGGLYELPTVFFAQATDSAGNDYPLHTATSPPALPRIDARQVAVHGTAPYTVAAKGGGAPWRVLLTPIAGGAGTVTVAMSLRDVDNTVNQLALIDVVVSLVVLLLLAGLGFVVVRSSLRPLVDVEHTAAAIAGGDLGRRVPQQDPRTEIGRLSAALNGMLGQIESAFRAQELSEAAARASEDRMRRFVADASHELRTPLTSIRGFAELYRQGAVPDGAPVARVMGRVEKEAARMGLLVDDLLLLARLDQQRPLDRRPVDLLGLAVDAVHDARAVAPDRTIELVVAGDGVAPVVLGDEARLRQVLANLVTNALTHTPAGTPVTVRVGTAGTSAVLDVSDEGPGLAAEEAERVFERFYRADPSRTRAVGGAGLGLSIVAALVAAHGGRVTVDSRPGAGATFRVLLPLTSDDPPTADRPAGQPGAPGADGPDAGASPAPDLSVWSRPTPVP